MMGIIDFKLFLISGIILNLTPGAAAMYILGKSISQGKKAGILSALGISTGSVFYILLISIGLSTLLANSSLAFEVLKYTGALYLIYLGIRLLAIKSLEKFEFEKKGNTSYGKIFISGVLTNLLNPKVALFFLAFLPQFIDPNYSQDPFPFLILGVTFLCTATIWNLILAVFSSKLSNKLRKNHRIKFWLDKITGGIFISLGIKLAFLQK